MAVQRFPKNKRGFNVKEVINNYKKSFKLFATDAIKVRDHNTAKILPFTFRPGQRIMHDIAEKRKAEKGFLRLLLLKNRRFGGSTYIAGRGYHRAVFNFNQNIFIIGHETDSTNTLFKMVQLFQEKNPIPPAIKTSNAQELIFDTTGKDSAPGLKSEYRLATAKNVEAGRSQGIHFLHCSEEAMWPSHSEELLTSLFSTIPRPPSDTEVWRESTGKGYGNSFQLAVFDAYAEGKYPYFKAPISDYAPHMSMSDHEFTFAYHNPLTDWVVIFIPWMVDPVCWKEFENDERKADFLKRVELAESKADDINHDALSLKKKFGLRDEQLYWREWSIVNECLGSIGLFQQENPHDIISAFRTKGSNHYSVDLCNAVENRCLSPVVIGNIMYRMGKTVIEPHGNGHVQIWERYDPRKIYFMTVDTAGGKREVHIKEKRDPDKTVIDVWDRQTGNQCAQWYGHMDYDMISDVVVAMGELYGRATACIELNNHGYKVVGDLKNVSYPQYYWKPGEAGWAVNKKIKPVMADDLIDGCRNGIITIRCKETVNEMRTYVEVSGKFGGESGTNDDRVTTAQMAVQMMSKLPRKIEMQNDYDLNKRKLDPQIAWMSH